jgi:acetyl-CoA acetyltransferase
VRDVYVAGVGMTAFGKFQDLTLRHIAGEAATAALRDADLTSESVEVAFFANAVEGLLTGQEMIVGQVALRDVGLLGVPIVNVENACASGSTAVHLAWLAVASGQVEWALAVGAEKLTHQDKRRPFEAMATGVDLGRLDLLKRELYGDEGPPPGERSFFMDLYADQARRYMQATGATVADYAAVAVKNHHHGSLNPRAQYREEVTVEEVLASRVISPPLTLLMCSPIGDGAAAVLLCSRESAERRQAPLVRVAASALVSGRTVNGAAPTSVERASRRAYEQASIGPEDLDLVELHDAAAPPELWLYEELGLCAPGDGAALLRSGASTLGGRIPVNTSGGLLSKGHPIAASGCAQIVELTEQLRGRADRRQVAGARVALAENNGGWLGPDPAATCVTILCRT